MKIVVLANGKLSADLAAQTGLTWRSELPFRGRTFIDLVIEALRPIGEVVVVGGPDRTDVSHLPGGETFFESFSRGVSAGGEGKFMMASADLPFLSEESVRAFMQASESAGGAICYSIVNLKTMEHRYGGMHRTSMKLKEGEFTGGNLFYVDSAMMEKVMPRMEAAYQARKNVLKLGALLGLPTLVTIIASKLIPGSVSVTTLENRVGNALGAPVRAIISEYPEIAADIDSSEHFAWLNTL